MIEGIDPWLLFGLVSLVVLLAGFVQSAIGFGYGIVGLALLPLLMDARDSHLLISVSGLPVLAASAWALRREIDWKPVGLALLGALTFLPLGIWLFGVMSLDVLVRATGLAIIVMVLASLWKVPPESRPASGKMSFLAGALSGFLSGAVSIGGPPIATFAMRQSWSPQKFKAFVVACLMLIASFRMGGLAVTGFLTQGILLQAAAAVPFAVVGVALGIAATRRINPHRFRTLVAVSLILIASQLIYRGSPDQEAGTTNTRDSSQQETGDAISMSVRPAFQPDIALPTPSDLRNTGILEP